MSKSDQQILEHILNQKSIDRFWSKVIKQEYCWIWNGPIFENSYGQFGPCSNIGLRAHRFSFALFNGKVPEHGFFIRHKCDNKLCVNPEHLIEGTQKQNVQDRIERKRGRQRKELTHCINGHFYIEGSFRLTKEGFKICKRCAYVNNLKSWAKNHIRL